LAVDSLLAAAARTGTLNDTTALLAVPTSINPIPNLRKSAEKIFPRYSRTGQDRTHLATQTLKALLLRHKDEAIPKTEHGERRARPQSKVFPKLLRNGKLAFFANLGRGQIFESGIVGGHMGRKILPQGPPKIKLNRWRS